MTDAPLFECSTGMGFRMVCLPEAVFLVTPPPPLTRRGVIGSNPVSRTISRASVLNALC